MKTKKSRKLLSLALAAVMVLTATVVTTVVNASITDFETQLAMEGFPESYKVLLRQLHEAHPDWKFEALQTGVTLEAATEGEKGAKCDQNFVYRGSDISMRCTCPNCYQNGQYIAKESGMWYGASSQTISRYLDPRNFLDESHIFQFLSLSFDSATQTEEGVERILAGTYMAGAKADYKDAAGNYQSCDKTYAQLIMEAAKKSGASAYYLASKIRQEIGSTPSTSTNGTHATYPGIYNFYNIGANTGAVDGLKWASASASDGEGSVSANTGLNLRTGPSTNASVIRVLPNGAKVQILSQQGDWYQVSYNGSTGYVSATYITVGSMSYGRPWTSPEISIINGAQWISKNYINQGQNTGYLQKFNVNPDSSYQMFSHEYMTNVEGAASEGVSSYNAYKKLNMLDTQLTFIIPVFERMPNDPGVSLTITEDTVAGLQLGATYQLNAYPYPTDLTVSWSSSDNNVATVNGSGLITAVGAGNAVITATAGGVSKSCAVQVAGPESIPAESVTISQTSQNVVVGSSTSLTASIFPENSTDSVTWSSSNPYVAKVDAMGNVVAVGVGEADIIASADSGVSASCHFYVNQRSVDTEYLTSDIGRSGTVQNVSSYLNVRSGPGIGYGVVTRINGNTGVTINYESGDWYNITASGNTGFVSKEYIKLNVQWEMSAGETALFGVTRYPADSTSAVSYSSSAPSIAAVDNEGVVTAKGEGEAVITAATSNGKTCAMRVKVKASSSSGGSSGNAGSTGTVTASSLNVRTGPGTSYTRIKTISKGTAVTVLGTSGDWYYISVGGQNGYVSAEYISISGGAPAQQKGTVTASSLNMRSGPGTSYSRITTLPRGTVVTVLSASGSWYQISVGGQTGYVTSEYLTVEGAASTRTGTVTAASLNVRRGAGTGYAVIIVIPRGTAVTINSATGGWYHVSFTRNGSSYTGYVSAEYIS